eukprot:TRINITY_DN16784_c0_g1_i1.p1 TRINITY_DN16784_c0_g1~~TRINITY_DN16784_c0_g1_i1.p1  ORF type:complete len:279 (+),score=136.79 TRINITY_DN16784_c0_g1_i1:114-950(+)
MSAISYPSKQIVTGLTNGVLTIRFNNPKRFNAWTPVMLGEMQEALRLAGNDTGVKAAIVTGTDEYYCAGVDFGGSMKAMRPSSMRKKIEVDNAKVFDSYISFPKPIVAAVNGPAIGASVTTAVLCDGMLASDTATFHTPFYALGLCAEGCSSYTFPEYYGAEVAERLIGKEGWKPNAQEALAIGMVQKVVPKAELQDTAQKHAEGLIDSGYVRKTVADPALLAKWKEVNLRESNELSHAFLGKRFLEGQEAFFRKRNKTKMADTFKWLRLTRPIWIWI